MTKELFINDILCDIDDSLSISLQYKSFLFTGFSDLQANRSWTVSLQKTPNNLAIIEQLHCSDSDSDFAYSNATVSYFIGGFPIISNGTAILLRISDKIEFQFVYGNGYENIKNLSERKLRDMTEVSGFPLNDTVSHAENLYGDWFNWNRSIMFNDATKGVGYAEYYGFTNNDNSLTTHADMPMATYHPFITFKKILQLIQRDRNVDLSEMYNLPEMSKYCTVLKDENGTGMIGISDVFDPVLRTQIDTSSGVKVGGVPSSPYKGFFLNNATNGVFNLFHVFRPDIHEYRGEITIFVSIKINTSLRLCPYTFDYVDTIFDNNYSVSNKFPLLPYTEIDGLYPYDYDCSFSFSFNITDNNVFGIANEIGAFEWGTAQFRDYAKDSSISISFAYNESSFGSSAPYVNPIASLYNSNVDLSGFYPIIPNLPDLSCSEFLIECMQLTGTFPYTKDGEPNKLYFKSADDIYKNIPLNGLIGVGILDDLQSKIVLVSGGYDLVISGVRQFITTTENNIKIRIPVSFINTKDDILDTYINTTRLVYIYEGYISGSFTGVPVYANIMDHTAIGLDNYTGFIEVNLPIAGDYTIRIRGQVTVYLSLNNGKTITSYSALGYENEENIIIENENIDSVAQDWSNYIIKDTVRRNDLERVDFTFGKYAKKNIIDYKANETNKLETGSSLEVLNTNLSAYQDLVRMKFSAALRHSTSDLVIDYPLYDVKVSGGVLTTEFIGESYNMILGELVFNSVSGKYEVQFTNDLLFSYIKDQKYTGYQKLIRKPRFLKDKFRIKPYQLSDFKPETPIYLSQYGKFYAIMTMQVSDKLIAECELLEIKEI